MSVTEPETATAIAAPPDTLSPAVRQSFLPTAFQVWIGISLSIAVSFAGVGRLFTTAEIPLLVELTWLGHKAVTAILAGIGGPLLFRAIQARQMAWMQPGHWLAVEMLGVLAISLLIYPLPSWPGFTLGMYYLSWAGIAEQALQCAIGTAWYVIVVRRNRESRAWRVFAWSSLFLYGVIGLLLLSSVLEASSLQLYSLSMFIAICRTLLVVTRWISAITATIQDMSRGNGRDTLHWVCLGMAALSLLVWVAQISQLLTY
jgi:hypothetical protein